MHPFKRFISGALAALVAFTSIPQQASAGAPPPSKLAIATVAATGTDSLTSGADQLLTLDRALLSFGGYALATSPSRVTVPTDGVYEVRGVAEFSSNTTGRRALKIVSIDATGVVLKTHETRTVDASANGTTQVALSTKAFLAAGEILGLVANQTSGGSLSTVAGAKLSVTREVIASASSVVVPGPWATKARLLLAKYSAAQPITTMTSPPTITVGTAAAASTLSGASVTAANYLATLSSTSTFTASIPAKATSTASSISATTLTIGGTVTGTFAAGDTISGPGVTAGTLILADLGGGNYTVDKSQTVTSIAIKALGDVMTVTAFTSGSGTLASGTGVSGGTSATGTQIVRQLSGAAGGVGTYRVSVVQDSASSAMTGGTPNPVFVDRGGRRSGGSAAAGQYITTANAGATPTANNGWGVRFNVSNGGAFDLALGSFAAGNGVRFRVDGKWADTTKAVIPDTSNIFYVKVALADGSGSHTIDAYFDKDVYFRGGNVSAGGTITAAPFPAGAVTVLFPADSYGNGTLGDGSSSVSESTGNIRMGDSIPYKVAEGLGLENGVPIANGGTGLLVDGTTRRLIYRSRDLDRFPNADLIIIPIGINDFLQRTTLSISASNVQAAETAMLAEYRSKNPAAIVLAVGAWRGKGDQTTQTYWDAQKAGTAAANDNGVCYIDPSPTGGNWQNAANDSLYMGADNTHPNIAGTAYLAGKLTAGAVACLTALAASSN